MPKTPDPERIQYTSTFLALRIGTLWDPEDGNRYGRFVEWDECAILIRDVAHEIEARADWDDTHDGLFDDIAEEAAEATLAALYGHVPWCNESPGDLPTRIATHSIGKAEKELAAAQDRSRGYASPDEHVHTQELSGGSWGVKAVPGQITAEFYGPNAKELARIFASLWNARILLLTA